MVTILRGVATERVNSRCQSQATSKSNFPLYRGGRCNLEVRANQIFDG